jgi:uncharacterized protein (DUF1786 family)
MKILTIDIGTGTQDIFLYNSHLDLENGFKLVVPSPSMIIHHRLREATRLRRAVLLNGVIMGGGPSTWAAEAHLRAGLPLYATPTAARTFNDDLEAVAEMGVVLLSEDESRRLPESVQRIHLADFDFAAIHRAFQSFGVSLDGLAAVAVAVFDHGNSPPDYSDRQFRFDYLDGRLRQHNRLSAFAYLAGEVPPIMTRLQAIAASATQEEDPALEGLPLVVMDTAPAAVLGATFDPQVGRLGRALIANVGNFHTLAFRLGPSGIEGVFEHHTGFLTQSRLEAYLLALADGSLRHADVFDDHGHGALVYATEPLALSASDEQNVVVTGPRRNLMRGSKLNPYFAAPFGDMMLSGCYGLLSAVADLLPELAGPIRTSLQGRGGEGTAPWDL